MELMEKKIIIEKAGKTGFCFGVERAVNLVEKVARERGGVETLGDIVHNRQVLKKLADIGVKSVKTIDEIRGDTVVTSSHGISPAMEEKIRSRGINIISGTCNNVQRAQSAAEKMADSGFFVIVYGDAEHAEVEGILGWAKNRGLATTDEKVVAALNPFPRKLGILSQTTQVPANFARFVENIRHLALAKDSEIQFIDTICHPLRERQEAALEMARRSDLILIVGGHTSANTKNMAELCSDITDTFWIETADDIKPDWLNGKKHIGVTSGASTAEDTVNEVLSKLREMVEK
jgi:4-hydroxy-3-methylbut-2-enyl diphosphate reductase